MLGRFTCLDLPFPIAVIFLCAYVVGGKDNAGVL